MVDESYMLEQPAPPSRLKVFVDQRATPVAIDALANVEVLLEQAAIGTRARPMQALGLAIGAGFLITMMMTRRSA